VSLLGFDTATAAASACLLRSDGEAFEVTPSPERLAQPPAHASELMPAVAEVMDASGVDWPELDAIAVGVGPGSFTGLRIGVTTARALAHAHELPLRPVSSLAALAAGIEDQHRLAVIDAKRGEVFAALYGPEGEPDGPHGPVWEPSAMRAEALAERVRASGFDPLAAGDGSVRFRGAFESAGIRVAPDGASAHVVRGLHVCRLAQGVDDEPPEAILPDYLRAPDAKPQ
jgi:tRNA threonylcarbamoyladenosine biosynthesis protein TsaB